MTPAAVTEGVKVMVMPPAAAVVVADKTPEAQAVDATLVVDVAVVIKFTPLQVAVVRAAEPVRPLEAMFSPTVVLAAESATSASETRARWVNSWYAGSAIAAKMPMMATTIISSIRVKPC